MFKRRKAIINSKKGPVTIRRGPNKFDSVLWYVRDGSVVEMLLDEGDQCIIKYNNVVGYIDSQYVVK